MPAENAQMKQFFKKEWINVTMYAVITLLLFCSMFWEPIIYAIVVLAILFCIFRPIQHSFYLIFFLYPYQMILIDKHINFSLYYVIFMLNIFIVGVKYLVDLLKKRKTFNIFLFILSTSVLLYCLLPIGEYSVFTCFRMLGITSGLYLCYEYKDQVSYKSLTYITSVGLILSCLFGFVAFETPRMLSLLTQYTNYGYIKFQGVLGNPNVLAIFNIIILPCLLVLYLKEHKWHSIFLFLGNFAFAYMTLSRNFIMCLAFLLPLYAILELVYYQKKGLLRVVCVALSMLAMCAVMFTSTQIYLVRFNILPESSLVMQTQQNVDAAVVLPSVPSEPNVPQNPAKDEVFVDDPGREGLWQRYWQDYTSNWKTILFGRGVGTVYIGNVAPHQSYLNILWQCGFVGTFLILCLFLYYFRKIFLKKNLSILFQILPFLIAAFAETIFFNIWTFFWLIPVLINKGERSNL